MSILSSLVSGFTHLRVSYPWSHRDHISGPLVTGAQRKFTLHGPVTIHSVYVSVAASGSSDAH